MKDYVEEAKDNEEEYYKEAIEDIDNEVPVDEEENEENNIVDNMNVKKEEVVEED